MLTMIGVRLNIAPYPRPNKEEMTGKMGVGFADVSGEARSAKPSVERTVIESKKVILEMVKRLLFSEGSSAEGRDRGLKPGAGLRAFGPKRSESDPASSRASVEVEAMMETCVEVEFDAGMCWGGGYSESRIVPKLLIYVSIGPVTKKKPAARNHMVGSVRKFRVSALRSQVFFRMLSACDFWEVDPRR